MSFLFNLQRHEQSFPLLKVSTRPKLSSDKNPITSHKNAYEHECAHESKLKARREAHLGAATTSSSVTTNCAVTVFDKRLTSGVTVYSRFPRSIAAVIRCVHVYVDKRRTQCKTRLYRFLLLPTSSHRATDAHAHLVRIVRDGDLPFMMVARKYTTR